MLGDKLSQLVQITKKASKYPKKSKYSMQDRIINSLRLTEGKDYKGNSFYQDGESIPRISCLTIKRSGLPGSSWCGKRRWNARAANSSLSLSPYLPCVLPYLVVLYLFQLPIFQLRF